MLTASGFSFYSRAEYLEQLIGAAREARAGSRLFVETMNFKPEESLLVGTLADELAAAAERGVRVTLSMDAHDFIMPNLFRLGPLWFHADFPKRMDRYSRQRLVLGERIRAAGGTFAITNQPHRAHTSPVSGRSHIKAAIVDDTVFLGGCNLKDETEIDIMLSWRDTKTADWLYDQLQREAKTQSSRETFNGVDIRHKVDERTAILIDAGVRGQSIIFEQALKLIDEAKEHVFLTCQYFPHGVTAAHLHAAAQRGVDVTLVYNSPLKHRSHAPVHQAVIWQERLRGRFMHGALPAKTPYLHAKVLATESAALIGSHNYVAEGVKFGTAEIALLRRGDLAFTQAAVQTILNQTPLKADARFAFWR